MDQMSAHEEQDFLLLCACGKHSAAVIKRLNGVKLYMYLLVM